LAATSIGVASMTVTHSPAIDMGQAPLVTPGRGANSTSTVSYLGIPSAAPFDSNSDSTLPIQEDSGPTDGPPSSSVHALFDLNATTTGPFPSNWFTVPDRTQNTGKRVNLPLPDCQTHPSDCEDVSVLNTLDGFNMQP